MTLSKLLTQTALRYEAATAQVLKEWSPECGCARPGTRHQCEACPCLAQFEGLVQKQISQMSSDTAASSSCSHVVSKSQL